MAGIQNNLPRIVTFKAMKKGKVLKVRLWPGFNTVDDDDLSLVENQPLFKKLEGERSMVVGAKTSHKMTEMAESDEEGEAVETTSSPKKSAAAIAKAAKAKAAKAKG